MHRVVQAAVRDGLGDKAEDTARAACMAAYLALPELDYSNRRTYERLTPHIRSVAAFVPDDMGQPLAWLLLSVGTYLQERAALDEVEPLFQRSLAISERLAKADPGNAGWQRDLSVSYNNVGDVLVGPGQSRRRAQSLSR